MENRQCLLLLLLLSTPGLLHSFDEVMENDESLLNFLKNVLPELLEGDEPMVISRDDGVNSLKEQDGSKLPSKAEAANQATEGASGPMVTTKGGQIQGLVVEKANIFYGIPYADPPVGAYRWKPPRPPSAWKGVYDASYPRAACTQICTGQITEECPRTVSEDCLYLNIFVPLGVEFSSPVKSLQPVMVWIHGGDFIAGTASKSLYDGRFFSNFTHTVVVSVEYRLGAFGFLVTGKNSQTSAVGNYGVLDQQAALLWVQRNIAAFGGDPRKVTIFGESAGAQSVSLHLMIQSSKPLFRQAALQSLPFTIPLKTRHDALKLGKEFSEQTNCSLSDIVCLLTLSPETVLKAQMEISSKIRNPFKFLEAFETWGPHIDGELIKEQAVTAFLKGHWQKEKSVLLGTTSEEGVLFAYAIFKKPVSTLESTVYVAAIFKQHTIRILQKYLPLFRESDRRNMLAQIITDYVFLCPSRKSARVCAAAGGEVWMYEFDHVASDPSVWSGLTFCYQHACHGAELPFLFNSASVANFSMSPAEKLLSNRMLCYWGAFTHTGDPSSRLHQTPFCREQRLPVWPPYSDLSGWVVMNLTVHSHAQVGTREHICDFWDQLSIYE